MKSIFTVLAVSINIVFTGDILLDRGVRHEIERHGPTENCELRTENCELRTVNCELRTVNCELRTVNCLFTPSVDSVFQQAQVVVGNLECPATKIKAPVYKRFIFRAEPEWLTVLKEHGFTHLNLANNHAIDQGRNGLVDTWRNIIEAGMTPVGAGPTMAEAAKPVLLATLPSSRQRFQALQPDNSRQRFQALQPDSSEQRFQALQRNIWLITSLRLTLENFPYLPDRPCVSQEPMDSLLARVARLRATDPHAVIIVSLHWGAEHTLKPVPAQRLDAHRLIDAGADALVCHHTHTLQTIETYRGHPIYYSLGNFIFDQQQPINTRAAMVQLTVTPDTLTATTIPITIQRCTPTIR